MIAIGLLCIAAAALFTSVYQFFRRRNAFWIATAATLIAGTVALLTQAATATDMPTKDGFLDEPNFFLVPLGFLALIVGTIAVIIQLVCSAGNPGDARRTAGPIADRAVLLPGEFVPSPTKTIYP